MALATLYASLMKSTKSVPRAHGIIIDHKVRPESTEEAEWVAAILRVKSEDRPSAHMGDD
jgi:hypothetical protein